MTGPDAMAKRAAAGTLALAVCLGGGVLAATRDHAEPAPAAPAPPHTVATASVWTGPASEDDAPHAP